MSTSVSSVSATKLDALTRERDAAQKALEEAQKARDAAAAQAQQAIIDRDNQQIADIEASMKVSESTASDEKGSSYRNPAAMVDVSNLKASVDAAGASNATEDTTASDPADTSIDDVRTDVNTLADALSRGDSDAALSASGSLSQSVRHALAAALASPAGDVTDAKGPLDQTDPTGSATDPASTEDDTLLRPRDARSERAEKAYQDQMAAANTNALGIAG